jgi:hypothetical protein
MTKLIEPNIQITVSNDRILHEGKSYKVKKIKLYINENFMSTGYVDWVLLAKHPKIIEEETELLRVNLLKRFHDKAQ